MSQNIPVSAPQQLPTAIFWKVAVVILFIVVLFTGTFGYVIYNDLLDEQKQLTDLFSLYNRAQKDISNLENQVQQIQGVSLIGNFEWRNNCPIFSDCDYITEGSFANFGTNAASSVSVRFTFYSEQALTGQVLCSTSYIVGTVFGRTIVSIPEVSCEGTSDTRALSSTYEFSWS